MKDFIVDPIVETENSADAPSTFYADTLPPGKSAAQSPPLSEIPWRWVWIVSFVVWFLLALGEATSFTSIHWALGQATSFWKTLLERCVAFTFFATVTPGVYWLGLRFPFSRDHWLRAFLIHLCASVLYSQGELLFGLTIVPSSLNGAHWATYTLRKYAGTSIFNLFNDVVGSYVVIVAVAQLMTYFSKYRERAVRAAELDTQLARTQLQFLRSQLNPHFLFNTLQSISALMEFDVKAADAMMAQLGDLLRSALDNMENQETTLQSELDFVGKYLNIEQHRLGSRLRVRFEIADETLDAYLPQLILQPIVENAIVHGISRIAAGGEMRIGSRRDHDDLLVSVRNDVPAVHEEARSRPSIGIGLRNTQERLKQAYGATHAVQIREVPPNGVEVSLRIPFRIADVDRGSS